MKRVTVLLVVALLAGFAAGQAAEKLKFPWVSNKDVDAMNAPCGKTELEYRCAANKLDIRPKPFRWYTLVYLDASPTEAGLLVKANIQSTTNRWLAATDKDHASRKNIILRELFQEVNTRFCAPDPDKPGSMIEIYENGELRLREPLRSPDAVIVPPARRS